LRIVRSRERLLHLEIPWGARGYLSRLPGFFAEECTGKLAESTCAKKRTPVAGRGTPVSSLSIEPPTPGSGSSLCFSFRGTEVFG
jgi:hypothetical protein